MQSVVLLMMIGEGPFLDVLCLYLYWFGAYLAVLLERTAWFYHLCWFHWFLLILPCCPGSTGNVPGHSFFVPDSSWSICYYFLLCLRFLATKCLFLFLLSLVPWLCDSHFYLPSLQMLSLFGVPGIWIVLNSCHPRNLTFFLGSWFAAIILHPRNTKFHCK